MSRAASGPVPVPAREQRRRTVRFLAALWIALLAGVPALAAAPRLEPLRYEAPAALEQVALARWRGAPALALHLRRREAPHENARTLVLVRPGAERWQELARWPLPAKTRYVEPIHLAGGAQGWLSFENGRWRILRPDGAVLAGVAACRCPTVYSAYWPPSRTRDRFAHDLDRDGVDELVLPGREGIEAWRVAAGGLTRLWRVAWNPEAAPLAPRAEDARKFDVPRVALLPRGPEGPLELLILGEAAVGVGDIAGRTGGRSGAATLRPRLVRLAGVPSAQDGVVRAIHAAEDMNGDGVPDLLHFTTLDTGRIFSQRNEMRWFAGNLSGGRLGFSRQPWMRTSDAGAFADLLRITRQGPPHQLVVAGAELSVAAVLQLLATGEASFDMTLFAWSAAGLSQAGRDAGRLTFRGIAPDNARPALLPADLRGDGTRMVLVNVGADRLAAYPWRDAGPLFGTAPLASAAVRLPRTDDTRFVADTNGDGREELVIWHRKGDLARRRTLIVVRLRGG